MINIEKFTNNEYILPRYIFGYWDDLENNSIIISHVNNWFRKINNWKIIILNKKNVTDYVSDDFFNKYSHLDTTRFSDFLRLELLKNYGGVWIDLSIIIIDGQFLDNMIDLMIEKKYDASVFTLKENSSNMIPYLENWFIMAPKNSKYIIDIYNEFIKSYDMGFLNYKTKILIPSGVDLNKTIGYGDRTYLMQHAIINYLMHRGKKYHINIIDSYDSMFKIHMNMNWNHEQIINFIENNTDWTNYYAIKLTKATRKYINDANKYIKNINMI